MSFNNKIDIKQIEKNLKKNEVTRKVYSTASSLEYKHNKNETKKQNIYIHSIQVIHSACYIYTQLSKQY